MKTDGSLVSDYRIARVGLLLSFLQINPGEYHTVKKEIDNYVDKNKRKLGHPFSCLFGLGKFDLILPCFDDRLFKDNSPDLGLLVNQNSGAGITDHNHIFSYLWEEKDKPFKPEDFKIEQPFIFLSFLKIDPQLLKQKGLDLELKLVRFLDREIPGKFGVKPFVLFNLGGHEALVITQANKLDKLIEVLVWLRNLPAGEVDSSLDSGTSFFLCSNTIPTIRENAPEDLVFNCGDGLVTQVEAYLSCNQPNNAEIIKELDKIVRRAMGDDQPPADEPVIQLTPGLLNLRFGFPARLTVNAYTNALLEIAKCSNQKADSVLAGAIRDIQTNLIYRHPDENTTSPKQPLPEKPAKNFFSFLFDNLWIKTPLLPRYRLATLGNALAGKKYDLIQESNVVDLCQALERFEEEKERDDFHDLVEEEGPTHFDHINHAVEYALNQRMVHSAPAVFDVPDRCFANRGGIQRIITAAEFLCRPMFEMSEPGEKWRSFVTFGDDADFTCIPKYHFVNFPYLSIFDVGSWVGMFHEAGHASFEQIEIKYSVDSRKMMVKENAQRQKWINSIVREAYCDIFAIVHGLDYQKEPFLYFFWSHIYHLKGSNQYKKYHGELRSRFLRSLMVYVYVKYSFDLDQSYGLDFCEVAHEQPEAIKTCIDDLGKIIEKVIPNKSAKEAFKRFHQNFYDEAVTIDTLTLLYKLINMAVEKMPQGFAEPVGEYYLDNLLKGEIVTVKDRAPSLVQSLLEGKMAESDKYQDNIFRAHMTAILSLWHQAMLAET